MLYLSWLGLFLVINFLNNLERIYAYKIKAPLELTINIVLLDIIKFAWGENYCEDFLNNPVQYINTLKNIQTINKDLTLQEYFEIKYNKVDEKIKYKPNFYVKLTRIINNIKFILWY
jgi:hypothetical protein